jgi:hypothetical protein
MDVSNIDGGNNTKKKKNGLKFMDEFYIKNCTKNCTDNF